MRFRRRRARSIDVVEALAGQRAGRLVLVDVREKVERAHGYPAGSRHLPLGELKSRMAELPHDRPVAFICHHGRRSAMAATAARRAGLDARNVEGGVVAWVEAGFEMERRST